MRGVARSVRLVAADKKGTSTTTSSAKQEESAASQTPTKGWWQQRRPPTAEQWRALRMATRENPNNKEYVHSAVAALLTGFDH